MKIYSCKQKHYKTKTHILHTLKLTDQLSSKIMFPQGRPTYRGQVIGTRHQIRQDQCIAKPETPQYTIPVKNIKLIRWYLQKQTQYIQLQEFLL